MTECAGLVGGEDIPKLMPREKTQSYREKPRSSRG